MEESFKRPAYLDYTGLQLAVYNVCYAVPILVWSGLDGFVLYSAVLWALAALCVYRLYLDNQIKRAHYYWFFAFLFAPYLWYVLFVRSYEDKALYLLLPAAVMLAYQRSPALAGALVGVLTGLIGVPIFVVPILLLFAIRQGETKRESTALVMKVAAMFVVGLLVSMVPFFPESLVGWERRSALEASQPFWFSGWLVLGDIYFAGLNKLTILALSIAVYLLYGTRRLTFNAALVLLVTFPLFFSVTMNSQRIVPLMVVLVLGFSTMRGLAMYAVPSFVLLLVFAYLDLVHKTFATYPDTFAVPKSILLLFPCLLGYVLIAIESFTNRIAPAAVATGEG